MTFEKGRGIAASLKSHLGGADWSDQIAKKLVELMNDDDAGVRLKAVNLVMDRLEGKPHTQIIEVSEPEKVDLSGLTMVETFEYLRLVDKGKNGSD